MDALSPLLCLLTLTPLSLASISWDKIYDGLCHEKEPAAANLDTNWVASGMTSGWYVPLSSLSHLQAWCYLLTGEPCASQPEMSRMCLKIRSDFTTNPFDLVHSGFGNTVTLNCTYTGRIHVCYAVVVDKYQNLIKHTVKVYLTYTDNKRHAIAIKCQESYGSGRRAWALMSTEPSVDKATRVLVLDHVKRLGYDPRKTVEMDYTTCD